MAFCSQASQTKVEIFDSSNFRLDTEPVKDILHIIRISSWLGLFPVKITARKDQGLDLRFGGCRLFLLVSITTFIFQLLYSIQISHRLLNGSSDATNKVVVMLDYFCFFISAIVVPRITLRSLSSLKIALARILTVDELLSVTTRKPKPPYAQYVIVSFFTATAAIMSFWVQARRNSTNFFLGEASAWLGFITFPLPKIYSILATWMVPLQLFTLCRVLTHNFSSFGEQMDLSLDKNLDHLGGKYQSRQNTVPVRLYRLQKVLVNLTDASDAVETYFRLPLLLFVSSRLVNLIRDSYILFHRMREIHLLSSDNYVGALSQLLNASNDLASFLFVIYAAELLQMSASDNKRRIQKCIYNGWTSEDGLQLHWFRHQVLGVKAKITGGGMFVVGKSMIPPVLGVIATYFFLLLQLSTGGK